MPLNYEEALQCNAAIETTGNILGLVASEVGTNEYEYVVFLEKADGGVCYFEESLGFGGEGIEVPEISKVLTVAGHSADTILLSVVDMEIVYAVGYIGPTGGRIFYVDEAGDFDWTYLEAAPADLDEKRAYSNISGEEVGEDAQGLEIGTGEGNTLAIISQEGHEESAALACYNLDVGGKSDFFLPSKDELNAMYENLHLEGLASFENSRYWSSSEHYHSGSWSQGFLNSSQNYDGKFKTFRVRCVRAF